LRLYPYVGPIVLAPLSLWLWLRAYHDLRLALAAWALPIIWAYVVPGIGTNVLKVWEFDVSLRLGHLRPQRTDFPTNFINSVVHGLLEQNKNI